MSIPIESDTKIKALDFSRANEVISSVRKVFRC